MSVIHIPKSLVPIIKKHLIQSNHLSNYHFIIHKNTSSKISVKSIYELIKAVAEDYGIYLQVEQELENEMTIIIRDGK